ncbi:4-hydroxy-tetrahydrodipicolinate synthase [Paenibacillus nasutitermitis]|uniref:4-hydroxy-tetrahydrodipicolinate synthase n=1 Tax=Paenibacillus nasutitermitis TaxID=1652958 RepID=A0A917DY98_9BACL|nr:4-hydroxy-tetrahydrodipicolinate synthase [Paenibacillus nasutitermitis]GGD81619.1 4-hydroxy-tetrahydrodipicolinate synthase 2 [Paenibacillus nasutitermitis]
MLMEQDLRGLFLPVVTPFLPNDELDSESYRNYLSKLLTYDIQGLVINGTTGESPTVSWEEVERLVQWTKEIMLENNRNVPLIIGTGTNDTASTIKRTEWAGQLGAEAVLVVIPYYNKPSQEGIIEHFRRVSQVGVPIIVYEIPSRTGVRLTTKTARTIMDLNGVIGLKDSTGGMELISELTRYGTKPVLCGDDPYFYAMLSQGETGGILASANVNTQLYIDVINLHRQGDIRAAKDTFNLLVPFIQLLFRESNPSPLKWLLARQGLIKSDKLRLPMSPITLELQADLEMALQRLPLNL